MLFGKGIKLRLALHVAVFRIRLHVIEHGGEGARAFADGFAQRPQPGGIDVRMTQRVRRGGGIARGPGIFFRKGIAGGAHRLRAAAAIGSSLPR